jgi:hypothetical protein
MIRLGTDAAMARTLLGTLNAMPRAEASKALAALVADKARLEQLEPGASLKVKTPVDALNLLGRLAKVGPTPGEAEIMEQVSAAKRRTGATTVYYQLPTAGNQWPWLLGAGALILLASL